MQTSPSLISAQDLSTIIAEPHIKIIDASWHLPGGARNPASEHAEGHLPHAVFFNLDAIVDPNSDLSHTLPSAEIFAGAAGALGISNDDTIVIYDDSDVHSSARLWWMFRAFGHQHVMVLDGGMQAWKAADGTINSDKVIPEAKDYNANLKDGYFCDWRRTLAATDDTACQIADARGAPRYEGTAPEPREGMRAGHIKNAVNLPFPALLNSDGTMKAAEEILALCARQNFDLDKPAILSCGSGITACVVALALEQVGKSDVTVYDGSWSEWGMRHDLPISTGKIP